MTIPPTFQIEQLPKNIMVRAPDTSFFFKRVFAFDSTHILLTESFEINQPVFDKANYSAIKDFFSKAYALMEEEIVLTKKK